MLEPISPGDPTRVVAVVLGRRYAGFAALDRWGLCRGGFGGWNLHAVRGERARRQAVRERFGRMMQRFLPALVVFAIGEHAVSAGLAQAAERAARNAVVPIVRARIGDAQALLLGRVRETRRALPARVVAGFFPELAPFVSGNPERERYRRPAFQAVAVALAALVERHPFSLAAMARSEAFENNELALALQRAALRPDEPI